MSTVRQKKGPKRKGQFGKELVNKKLNMNTAYSTSSQKQPPSCLKALMKPAAPGLEIADIKSQQITLWKSDRKLFILKEKLLCGEKK